MQAILTLGAFKKEIILRICFVILHYLIAQETQNCIESLLELPLPADSKIVVVDNGSNNGSYEKLRETFLTNERVIFLHNDKNLGFAGGNNVGYEFAQNQLHADAIAILNNDLVIRQQDFLTILSADIKDGYDLIGPDVFNLKDKTHQSPLRPPTNYRKELIKFQLINLYYSLIRTQAADTFYQKVKEQVGKRLGLSKKKPKRYSAPSRAENVQLHGACLIFANRFVQNEKYAFDPRTFLYGEETLLFQYCMRKHYRILFDPNLCVLHNASASTEDATADTISLKRNRMKYYIQSRKLILQTIKKYGKYVPQQ